MKPLVLTAILALLLPCGAQARTWQIFEDGSGDAPTVQAGIDSAAVGDTVLVGPGTYLEDLNYLGKDIVLTSSSGPEATIIDGSTSGQYWVVLINSGESRAAILERFTITGASVGVRIRNAEPSIISNIIRGNHGGGGIAADDTGQTIWRPRFAENVVQDNSADAIGAGICVTGGVVPEIRNNEILNNTAHLGDGGGIYLRASVSGAVITGNRILGNHADDMGGGIFASWTGAGSGNSGYVISWNIIQGNSSNSIAAAGIRSGGGIYLGSTGAWVHHNTIVENRGYCTSPEGGGGITLCGEVNPRIEQNIVVFNNVGTGIACLDGTTADFHNNLIWGNEPNDLDAACAALWSDNGNITADPDFCDRAGGDFSLGKNSPAITHPAGPLGAIAEPGCEGTVPTRHTTWGWLKSHFKNP